MDAKRGPGETNRSMEQQFENHIWKTAKITDTLQSIFPDTLVALDQLFLCVETRDGLCRKTLFSYICDCHKLYFEVILPSLVETLFLNFYSQRPDLTIDTRYVRRDIWQSPFTFIRIVDYFSDTTPSVNTVYIGQNKHDPG